MQIQKKILNLLFCLIIFNISIFAGERTIPVDFFVMIDKSLSMAEPGKFESLHSWVKNHLVTQMLIPGDWISIYQFYGNTEHLTTLEISNDADIETIVQVISNISPDGTYTDIGQALDTVRYSLSKRDSDRLKILYLLTDLRHEAPWSSRYAGTTDNYEHPYLAEARILTHDNWFEITLDMDIQESVVKTSHELYESIISMSNVDRVTEGIDTNLVDENEPDNTKQSSNATNTLSGNTTTSLQESSPDKNKAPILQIFIILAILLLIVVVVVVIRAKKPSEEKKKDTQELL